jgi:hypothetical protein
MRLHLTLETFRYVLKISLINCAPLTVQFLFIDLFIILPIAIFSKGPYAICRPVEF